MDQPVSLLICVGLGLGFIGLGLWARHMNAQAARWPSTVGTVLAAEMDENGSDAPSAKIRYTYQVAGQVYESKNIGYIGQRKVADRDLVAMYPAGAAVEVYFDPAKPWRATLQRGPSLAWLVPVAFGLALIVLPLLLGD